MALIEINWNPDRRQLRGFGVIAFIAFGAIGSWIYFRHGILGISLTPHTAVPLGYALWTLGGLCGLGSLAAPWALRPLYLTLTVVSMPIGFVVSHVLMGLLFYVVITPIGLIFRLLGRDPLCRAFDPTAKSYWVGREVVTDVKRYYRQF